MDKSRTFNSMTTTTEPKKKDSVDTNLCTSFDQQSRENVNNDQCCADLCICCAESPCTGIFIQAFELILCIHIWKLCCETESDCCCNMTDCCSLCYGSH